MSDDLTMTFVPASTPNYGFIHFSVHGRDVWPRDFEWTWSELAAFIRRNRDYLVWEQHLPYGFGVAPLPQVRAQLKAQSLDLPEVDQDKIEEEWEDFLLTHDLAMAVEGAALPSVVLVRVGRRMWFLTDDFAVDVSAAEAERVLGAVADQIAAAWSSPPSPPHKLSAEEIVQLSTRLAPEIVREIEADADPEAFWELGRVEVNGDNELLAAARSSRGMAVPAVRELLQLVRSAPATAAAALDAVSDAVRNPVGERPYEQGYDCALKARSVLGHENSGAVDTASVLAALEVNVRSISIADATLDAVSSWGPLHGPIVFLNEYGEHNRSTGGRNATFAHELCHLLLDREESLPLVEVLLTTAQSSPAEARARAFAAEFLLPREVAAHRYQESKANTTRSRVQRIAVSARVSVGLAAWQVLNSHSCMTADEVVELRALADRRQRRSNRRR